MALKLKVWAEGLPDKAWKEKWKWVGSSRLGVVMMSE